MAAASTTGDGAGLPDSGLEFLLHLVDRFPLGEVIAQVEQPDPLVMRDVVPSDTAGVDSSCALVLGHLCGPAERRNSRGKRKERRRGGPVDKNKISVLSDWMVLIFCK